MSLLDKLFGNESERPEVTITLKTEFIPSAGYDTPYQPSRCDILLKEATEHKKIRNWPSAIKCLREAYADIEKVSTIYPIDTFLRLPMYMFEAGQKEEAWQEFMYMMIKRQKFHAYFDLHAITDKMRLCMQREKRRPYAVKFGVISYLYGALARFRQAQEMKDDPYVPALYLDYIATEATNSALETLLKGTGREFLTGQLATLIHREIENFPQEFDVSAIACEIDRMLNLQ
jgi:hypothetical protein